MWQHIQYKDGSNPYICKTEEEFLKIYKKYGKRLQKIKDGFYIVKEDNQPSESLFSIPK